MTLPDSGTRTVYPSGAIKEAASVEKGRYDLIPPGALHRLAVHYARGAEKYPPGRTWEAGLPWSVLIGAALRHAFQWLAGAREEDHLAAVAWQIFALMDGEQRHPECCDVPSRVRPLDGDCMTGTVSGVKTYPDGEKPAWCTKPGWNGFMVPDKPVEPSREWDVTCRHCVQGLTPCCAEHRKMLVVYPEHQKP